MLKFPESKQTNKQELGQLLDIQKFIASYRFSESCSIQHVFLVKLYNGWNVSETLLANLEIHTIYIRNNVMAHFLDFTKNQKQGEWSKVTIEEKVIFDQFVQIIVNTVYFIRRKFSLISPFGFFVGCFSDFFIWY